MSDTQFSKSDLIRKITGLLATAESFAEQGNDEAAQAYVQKAHELQSKYSIDQAMLAEKTGKQTEKIISKRIPMPGKWGKRKVSLAHVVAHQTNCTGYYTTGYGKKLGPNLTEVTDWDGPKIYFYTVFGFESDVEHVEFLLNSLSRQMDLALVYAKKSKPGYTHGKSFGASFCMGFASVIGQRLAAAAKSAEKQAAAEYDNTSTSTALVLVSRKKQVEEEMTARVGGLRKGTSSSATSYAGYSAGRVAGSSATIARGSVNNGSKGSLNK